MFKILFHSSMHFNCDMRGIFTIITETYSPYMVLKKTKTVLLLRLLKCAAIFINERTGQLLFKWKKNENVILDKVGRGTETLFTNLYNTHITQGDVYHFLYKRLLFCSITSFFTAIHILFFELYDVKMGLCISLILLPITVVDRQWTVLVTKMFPRYERSKIIKIQHNTHLLLSPAIAVNIYHRATKTEHLCYMPDTVFVIMEMCIATLQILCGVYIFVFTCNDLFSIFDGKNIEFYPRLIIIVRIAKEITNFVSFCLEYVLTPLKFKKNSSLLEEFLSNLAKITSPEQVAHLINKDIKTCLCLDNYLKYAIDKNHNDMYLLISHIHCFDQIT